MVLLVISIMAVMVIVEVVLATFISESANTTINVVHMVVVAVNVVLVVDTGFDRIVRPMKVVLVLLVGKSVVAGFSTPTYVLLRLKVSGLNLSHM